MRHHSLIAMTVLLIAACGGSSPRLVDSINEPATDGDSTQTYDTTSTILETPPNVTFEDSRLFLTTPWDLVANVDSFTLEPAIWPRVGQEPNRPVIAMGHVYRLDDGRVELVPWFQLSSPMTEVALTAIPAEQPAIPSGLKVISTIAAVSGNTFTVPIGLTEDVEPGDIYFVMNATTSGDRLGDRIGAMATVTTVGRGTSTLVTQHAQTPPQEGDIVLFVQSHMDYTPRETTLYFALLQPEAEDTGQLSPLAAAVPQLLADFGISNILFATLPQWLDPEPAGAAQAAAETIETLVQDDDAFGAVAFGRVDGNTLVFNAGSWGSATSYGGLIGILPGGLRIELQSDLETAAAQLAPSFVATGLAMRGDHALAAYLLEITTRDPDLQADVRYHLREHIAVRWLDLGRADETLRILEHDVLASARSGEVRAQLNALSVLISVYHSLGNCDSAVTAARQYLDLAEQEIPLSARESELTRLALCLRDLDSPDAADAATQALDAMRLSSAAASTADLMALEFRLAEGSLERLRAASATLQGQVMELAPQEQVNFLLLQARAFAEVGDATEAQLLAARALEIQAQHELDVSDNMKTALALTYLFAGDRQQASDWLTQAAAAMLSDGTYGGAAQFLLYAARLEFSLLSEAGFEPTPEFVNALARKLDTSCRLYRILGNSHQAGECMATLAILQTALGQHEASMQTFERAAFHMVRSANLEALIVALETRARQMEAAGALDAASSLYSLAQEIDIRQLIEERYPQGTTR